jgi:hypothetical protein
MRLVEQMIKMCHWQPPSKSRDVRVSARKEFKSLVALLPSEVQVPVQVSQPRGLR